MIKIFLVEDEVIVRNGIRDNIDWEKEGMEFVGEAGDGELAYPLIKKTEPDILITDIQMPFMDGLELSRLVKKELPKTRIVILSGYGEFDYAKQAIGIGVTDYLLKPISSAKLLEAVREVADAIEEERQRDQVLARYREEMEENRERDRQKLLCRLLSGAMSSMEVLEQAGPLGIRLYDSAYLVLRYKIIPDQVSGRISEHLEQAGNEIRRQSDLEEHIRWVGLGIEGFAFIIGGEDEGGVRSRLEKWEDRLTAVVRSYPDLHYFGGVGAPVKRLGDIPGSYQDANRAFASRFFLDQDQIVDHDQAERLQEAAYGEIDLDEIRGSRVGRRQVETFLKNGTTDELKEFIEEYFQTIGERNYQSLMFRQYMVMDMYLAVVDFLETLGLMAEELTEESRDVNGAAAGAGSIDRVKRYAQGLFGEALALRDSLSRRRYGYLLEEAKRYIRENFQNREISLNTVASQVNISPSYFSAVFSQETGQTFVEYLTGLRIEKAKELLMCTDLRASEVGYQVGYNDSHYFSYIFKKTVNCTPREYRMRGKAER